MLKFLPSMLVASSLYLANILREEPESWTEQLVQHTGYITGDLEACVGELRALIRDVPRETVLPFSRPPPLPLTLPTPCLSFPAHIYGRARSVGSGRCLQRTHVYVSGVFLICIDDQILICAATEVQGGLQEVLPSHVRVCGPASGAAAPRHGRNYCCCTLKMRQQ